ncbi:hypothetical protein MKY85_20545 [Paenibacillus sp. FSL R5-0749]|uniref:hypothetical protein n=1 Tax=Paenibacillus sp. FSL R5-0749 TaxID=2921657 RepID=UPI00315AA8B1
MLKYQLLFPTCLSSEIYCLEIVQELIGLFDISEKEAFLRINSFWEGNDFTSEDDLIFHELPEYWAKTIYYEKSNWWNFPENELIPRKID